MNNNIPYFEVNGVGYAIKRTRFLQAEFDAFNKSHKMTDEEELAYAREQEFDIRSEKLLKRKNELYDKYLETFDEEDEKLYKKAEIAYNLLLEEASKIENISGKRNQRLIDCGERLIIKSLQYDANGDEIRSNEEATSIWESFVDEIGKVSSIQFIVFTMNYIMGGDEEVENPFITQAKAKAEQRANMKKGIAKAK